MTEYSEYFANLFSGERVNGFGVTEEIAEEILGRLVCVLCFSSDLPTSISHC